MAWSLASMKSDRDAEWNWIIETTPQLSTAMVWHDAWGDGPAWGWDGEWRDHITYLSYRPFSTSATDTPASTTFHPVLIEPVNFLRSAPFEGDGGIGQSNYGAITIALPEELDDLLASYWTGRIVRLLAGGTYNKGLSSETTAAWSEYAEVGRFFITDFDYDETALRLYLRDPLFSLDTEIPREQYLGDTGADRHIEGDDSLKGRPKPLAIGVVKNVEAVLVAADYNIYQVSARVFQPISGGGAAGLTSIEAVRDQGTTQTAGSFPGGVDPTLHELFENAPSTDQYYVQKLHGLFRLGGAPEGSLTVDLTGGYTDATIANVIKRIIYHTDGGAQFHTSFSSLGTEAASAYLGAEEINAAQIISEILNNAGLFMFINRDGEYQLGEHVDLSDSTSYTVAETLEGRKSQDSTPLDIVRLSRLSTRPPVYSVNVAYDKNYFQQEVDELPGVAASVRYTYSEPSKFTGEALNGEIQGAVPTSRKVRLEGGYLTSGTDAETIRDAILDRQTIGPDLWEIEIVFPLFTLEVGDVVTVFHDRFGFDNGKDAEVISMTEQHDRTILTVVTSR